MKQDVYKKWLLRNNMPNRFSIRYLGKWHRAKRMILDDSILIQNDITRKHIESINLNLVEDIVL